MHRTAPGNPLFLRDEAIDLQFELWLLAGAGLGKVQVDLLAQAGVDAFDLVVLVMVGRHEGLTMANLVDLTGRPKQILSRRIQLMVQQGLIERTPDRSDRRRQLLRLSEAGQTLVEQSMGKMRHYLRRAFSRAGSSAVEGFAAVLLQMIEPGQGRRFGHTKITVDQDRN